MLDRPRGVALLAVNLVALGIVAFMLHLNSQYFATRLPTGDVGRNLSQVLRAMELADAAGFREAVVFAAHDDTYVLHPLVAVLLHPLLPRSFAVAPILNGIWLVIMANVLCILFLKESRSAVAATLLTVPPLVFMPAMSTTRYGFIGLDANLLAYLLACSIFASVVLSEGLTQRRWVTLAGAMFGCLVLGRLESAGLVGIALAPLLLVALGDPQTRRKAIAGLAIAVGAAFLVCGAWIQSGVATHWAYYRSITTVPGQTYPSGFSGFQSSYLASIPIWARTLDGWLSANLSTALCWLLLSWVTAREVLRAESSAALWSRLDWARLLLFAAPAGALVMARVGNPVYAFPAYFGLYLFATQPFHPLRDTSSIFGNTRYQVLLAIGVVSLLGSFFYYTTGITYADEGVSRQETLALLRPALDDPKCTSSHSDLRITMTYYHGLTDHNLVNDLVVDLGQPAVQGDRPNSWKVRRRGGCVVNVLLDTFIGGPEYFYRADPAVTDRVVSRLERSTDYAVVLAPETWTIEREQPASRHWPQWVDISRRLLESDCWTAVGTAHRITPWESAILLRRSCNSDSRSALPAIVRE